ncbi:hypothetical protein NDU88_007493 [Pleurodeles waltl]|uniref:Uncharacterized protein n=1 Tax=Pleurodeles waltl TaxID=8319 RepID=A0AAV7RTE0_PLEWA|nr:hypothetical protein NDU88_007493 [Pleurodeles waltl]
MPTGALSWESPPRFAPRFRLRNFGAVRCRLCSASGGGSTPASPVPSVCRTRQCQPSLVWPAVPARVRRAVPSGRSRSPAERSLFFAGGTSVPVGVHARLRNTCSQWFVVISLWPPNNGAKLSASPQRGRYGVSLTPTAILLLVAAREGHLLLTAAAQGVPVGQVPVLTGGPIGYRATPVLLVLGEAPLQGGAPAGPVVPPQCCYVPPPRPRARAISPSFPGSSSRARRGPLLTRGRGFGGEERPQFSSPPRQPRAGCNVCRARPGGPAAPLTFRQRGRMI